MPVKVISTNIYSELSAQPINWLLANRGDKIRIEQTIVVETTSLASSDNPIILNATDGYIGVGWAVSTNNAFEHIVVGDTINWGDYSVPNLLASFTVINKLSDNEIEMNIAFPSTANDYISNKSYFSVTTPITAVRYKWNFIENDDQPTFASKVDGTIQEAAIHSKLASDTGLSAMVMLGSKCYQIGNITIEGVSILSSTFYRSTYKIIHHAILTPFFLAQQLADFLNSTAPDYYFNAKCLKGIFDFEAMYNFTDPNRIQTEQITEVQGNTGWINENFNTGLTNYYIDSVVYKRPDTSIISAIELVATETTVEIVIKNTIDNPFVNNLTKCVLNFVKIPFDATEYQGNGRTQKENFIFDRRLITIGAGTVNGDNYGTDLQVLKDITGTFISSSEIKITCKTSMVTNVLSILNESNEKRYELFVSVQNHTLVTAVADKVSFRVDTQLFFVDNSDPTMIGNDFIFLRHPESDRTTEGIVDLDVFPEDEVVASSQFWIDKTGRLTDTILIKNVTVKVKAKNYITLAEFDLDKYSLSFNNLTLVAGVQDISQVIERVFHTTNGGDPKKAILVQRRYDLDNANKYYYDFSFPFLVRWEYWKKLQNANTAFFNNVEPHNNLNNKWHNYTLLANWGLYFEITINATKNGLDLAYPFEYGFTSNNYNSNADYILKSIKSYDNDTNALLYDGVSNRKFINGFKTTRIEAVWTKVSALPDINVINANLGIEVYEQGGIEGKRRYSSKWTTGDTWLKSIDLTPKTKITIGGFPILNEIKATCLVDNSLIPIGNNLKFKICARLYDFSLIANGKMFQTGDAFKFQNNNGYKFQGQ